MTTPNPLAVMRARTNRLVAAGSTPAYSALTGVGRTAPVPLVALDVRPSDPADQRHYTQPQTGAVLTIGALEDAIDWEHDGHAGRIKTYALVEKPKRVMVLCETCGGRWDEKR